MLGNKGTKKHYRTGGTRGGLDQFKWEDVKTDKDRENYLGHSVLAPVGRWQKGRDLNWYAKGKKVDETIEQEKQRIREMDEELINNKLGIKSTKRKVFNTSLDNVEVKQYLSRGEIERGDNDAERVKGLGAAPVKLHDHIETSTFYEKEIQRFKEGKDLTGEAATQLPGVVPTERGGLISKSSNPYAAAMTGPEGLVDSTKVQTSEEVGEKAGASHKTHNADKQHRKELKKEKKEHKKEQKKEHKREKKMNGGSSSKRDRREASSDDDRIDLQQWRQREEQQEQHMQGQRAPHREDRSDCDRQDDKRARHHSESAVDSGHHRRGDADREDRREERPRDSYSNSSSSRRDDRHYDGDRHGEIRVDSRADSRREDSRRGDSSSQRGGDWDGGHGGQRGREYSDSRRNY